MINHALQSGKIKTFLLSVKSGRLHGLSRLLTAAFFIGAMLLGFTSTAHAAALPKNWTPGTGISGGELAAPTTGAVVAPGASVTAAVSAASDSDHWTQGSNSGDSPDTITYAWSCDQGGSFASPNSASTTWTAPTTAGSYTLVCVINDGAVVPVGDTGNRDDAALVRSVTVEVKQPTLAIISDKSSICAGGVSSAVHQATINTTVTQNGQPVVGVSVSFSVDDSNPDYPSSLSASSAVTTAEGIAKVELTSSKLIGATATVKATYSGVEATTSISMGSPTATWDIDPTELIADGESSATVTATLNFAGKSVDKHSVTWSISEVQDEDGKPVSLDSGSYGSLDPTSGETKSDGSVRTTYKVGTQPGTVTFQIIDGNLYEEKPKASQMQNSPDSPFSAIEDGSTGNVSIGNKTFIKNKNLQANVFYVYTLVGGESSDESAGFTSGIRDNMKFTVALKALIKRSGTQTPTLKSINFNEFRPTNNEQSSPILGSLDSTGTPAGTFTTWAYKSASPHWDITKLKGRWNIIVKLTDGSIPPQQRKIFKIEKRDQVVQVANSWVGANQQVGHSGDICDDVVRHIYRHVDLDVAAKGTTSELYSISVPSYAYKGDMIFYRNTTSMPWQHVGTHVGGKMIVDQNCGHPHSNTDPPTVGTHLATHPDLQTPTHYNQLPFYRDLQELRDLDTE